MPKHDQKPSLRRRNIALATLTATLTMGLSHQAMAACVASSTTGTVVDCSDTSELPTTTFPTVSISDFGSTVTNQVGVRLTTNGTKFENETTIESKITDVAGPPNRYFFNVYGVATTDIDDSNWTIDNKGKIHGESTGLGNLAGVAVIGDAGEARVTNTGEISIKRGDFDITTNSATQLRGQVDGQDIYWLAASSRNNPPNPASSGYAASIWIQEEENEAAFVENKDGGKILAEGKLTAGIFSRGNFLSVENEEGGLISVDGAGATAIAAHNGSDTSGNTAIIGNTSVVNDGEIKATGEGSAAIQISDVNGLFLMASRVDEGTGAGYDPRTITSQAGRRDSTIVNSGSITGDMYLGAGNHVLVNTGDIEGNLTVDQRRNFTYATGATQVYRGGEGPADEDDGDGDDGDESISRVFNSMSDFLAALPDHYFEFNNAKPFDGDVTIHTNVTTGDSKIVLMPHITGPGSDSTNDNPSKNSGYIDGTLSIGKDGTTSNGQGITVSTIATTTTLKPVIDSTVRNNETFLVASHLYGTEVPTDIDNSNSVLVKWSAYQVGTGINGAVQSGDALAVKASVKDASEIEGISKSGAAAINALIAAGSDDSAELGELGAAVQNLTDEDDVAKAGKQLSPETNFATQQAAITLNNAIGQHIDTRLNSVGATGASQGYTNAPYGLGMKQQQTDPNRSNLGGSLKDDQDFIAPRSAALWGQAFGAGMNQNERQNVDAYDARIYGLMVGYDNWISPGMRVGIAGGYANTRIDGDGDTTKNSTDIDSYLVEAYGAIKGSGWYATGRTGFTWHDYDTVRAMTEPLDDVAKGSHNGDQFNASIEFGAPMNHSGTIITPVASLTYSRLHQDGYSETSDGAMALSVGSQNNDSFVSGLGVKALVPIANDTIIEGRALWLHEFADNAQIVTASFAAGGGTFTAAGPNVGRDSADLGIGMIADIGFNSTFQINYDANVREDYLAHVGSARVDVHF